MEDVRKHQAWGSRCFKVKGAAAMFGFVTLQKWFSKEKQEGRPGRVSAPLAEVTAESVKPLPVLLALTAGLMTIMTSVFELVKHRLIHNLTLWESHEMTIFFSAVMAASSAFFVFRNSRKLHQQVMAKQEQLTALAMELALVEERERRNIAGELHDQVGQLLVLCRIKLNALSGSKSPEEHACQLKDVGNLLDRAIQDVRSLSMQLSPPLLRTAGLGAALEWLGEEIKADYGLQVAFRGYGRPGRLEDEMQTAIFHGVRELLINAAKHARAKQATITLSEQGAEVVVLVEDNGIGFDVSGVSLRKSREGGFGLFNIRQKIEYLGGRLLVESRLGLGTRTTIRAFATKEQTGAV
jgi:signal transduction histidine kinase